MERVHIDMMGPFVESVNGNRYILMVIDQFTKWVECYHVLDQTSETVGRALVDNFITRFGTPIQIHSDQGRTFDGRLFHALCELLEITKTRTTPYRPCSNGQVERQNRTILQCIRCYNHGVQRHWDRDLPLISMAIRSTVNRSTGFTPNFMMLGREISLAEDLLGIRETNLERENAPEFVKNLLSRLTTAHKIARDTLQAGQKNTEKLL
jgi:hypothetical protein